MRTPSAPATPSFDSPITTAETAVAALEAIAPGRPFAEPAEVAAAAVAGLYDQAAETLCPSRVLPPVTPESLVDFATFTAEMPHERTPEALAALFGMAAAGRHAGLMKAIAGPRGLQVVRLAATASAVRMNLHGADATAHVDGEIRRFIDGLAAQLRETEAGAVGAFDAALSLEGRIEACRVRHAAHRQAELARIEAEERAAAEAVERAEAQTRAEIAAYFASRHSHAFIVKGEALSGQALAAIAQRRGVRSGSGEFITLSLDELSNAYRRALAADAAAVEGIAS